MFWSMCFNVIDRGEPKIFAKFKGLIEQINLFSNFSTTLNSPLFKRKEIFTSIEDYRICRQSAACIIYNYWGRGKNYDLGKYTRNVPCTTRSRHHMATRPEWGRGVIPRPVRLLSYQPRHYQVLYRDFSSTKPRRHDSLRLSRVIGL